MFSLHPQLNSDTIPIGDLPLSMVLLVNSAELPWLILVPRRENISEWYNLVPKDQQQLHNESIGISSVLMNIFEGDKLNIGALGNMVPQLHVHHIVRYKHDSVWPLPVWGNIQIKAYSSTHKNEIVSKLQQQFSQQLENFSAC